MPKHPFAATALAAAVALAAPAVAQQQDRPALGAAPRVEAGPTSAQQRGTAPQQAAGGAPQAAERQQQQSGGIVPRARTVPAEAPGRPPEAGPPLPVEEKLNPERARKAEERPGAGRFIAAQEPGRLTTDEIIGTKVLNVAGEEVGEVRALLFEDGRIAAAVIGVGGFLGLGEKDVALRWDRIEAVPDGDGGDARLTVDLTRQDLERAPDFKTLADIRAEEAVKAQERSMFKNSGAGAPGEAEPRTN